MGLWVSELPGQSKAQERVTRIKIPGRSGDLTLKDGDNVFDAYLMECVVTARRDSDFEKILEWLSGNGDLVLSSSANRAYDAQITAEITFDNIDNNLCQATIPFYVQPLKKQYPPESNFSGINEPYTIYNPGNVPSRPLVIIGLVGGSQTLQIANRTMTFSAEAFSTTRSYIVGDHVIYNLNMYRFYTSKAPGSWDSDYVQQITSLNVDCESKAVYSQYGIFQGNITGEFWEIPVGTSTVYASSNVGPTIIPRWRWR